MPLPIISMMLMPLMPMLLPIDAMLSMFIISRHDYFRDYFSAATFSAFVMLR